ncbi:single-stranded-DNA-specific exonuclease RecJ [Rickettsia prowazekii]|uniref:Single-stranded-DNA-specific exonuclease RecJ n=2 Tax=Rickettsia prowazekii TaxID=782 RepID=Q9ZD22_RICPR|nr:single-stranded-DNA-specific exonuclease RecJ [Rickettsia prowazekii]ADE30055.1 Single-stranded-DNA-specific exonuclease RecJ [Rickettsia prowazekii str. Rp22]AFE49331.1 single-stranded-DNA-specific exonuclease RecJ [Rickettsia prowazekii str. Chernikova]AFE50176.1 single-stranded-DNA-specific exonuclease RecJ [Rickettsia prowazekii str. Katsinyian]AFE51022.1 single-stranded-DNA-specific exonuclease RecJ [Rickettsia prowazekii str. BuV67-CWPP]AFE51857.1 single-stranded-DNA-specific exonucle
MKPQISINGKIWKQKPIKEDIVTELCRSFKISDFLARIVSLRVNNLEEVENFLIPKIKNLLPDPFHLLDMDKAVDRIIQAIVNSQQICIFADYDVDGATSAALLKHFLRDLNIICDIYVPDRIYEGYGPTPLAMQKIKGNGTELLITVDCGAMAHDALKYAKDVKLDVIVIDHHISTEILPDAVAIVNPNRIDETSEYKYLAAVGVTFLFATAILSNLKKRNYFSQSIPTPNLMKYLDLVALGTVCDMMKLTGLNRAFVTAGLKVMQQRQNIGIKTLYDIAGLDEIPQCYHLGFILGPRINAGGRVGKSNLGANLLATNCHNEANKLANELEKHNNERKVIELLMINEAIDIALTQKDSSLLFVVKEGWHPGVIGIVAGKLKEKFDKPVVVVALNNGIGKASCRSILGIDFSAEIINAKSKDLIISGGGHAMAAGFTATASKLQELQDFLNDAFSISINKLASYKHAEYDIDLTVNGVNFRLMEELKTLEPFGPGNYEPIFKFDDLFILKADIVGSKHIKCMLAPDKQYFGNKALSAIVFDAVGTPFEDILLSSRARHISAIGTLKMNNWKYNYTIQLIIKDILLK